MDCISHGVTKSQTRLSDFHFHPGLGQVSPGHLPRGCRAQGPLHHRGSAMVGICRFSSLTVPGTLEKRGRGWLFCNSQVPKWLLVD